MSQHLKEETRICPTCLGAGKLINNSTYKRYTPKLRAEARRLFRNGLSYRAIGKAIGVNHPQKVYSLINSKII